MWECIWDEAERADVIVIAAGEHGQALPSGVRGRTRGVRRIGLTGLKPPPPKSPEKNYLLI